MKFLFLTLCLVLNMFSFEYKAKDFTYLIKQMPKLNRTLLEQHFMLYKGYVKQVNFLNRILVDKRVQPFVFESVKRQLGFEFDGMRLHELYFANLGGDGRMSSNSDLYQALVAQFGSMSAWVNDLRKTCMTRGVGWVVLFFDEDTKQLYNAWITDHSRGALVKGTPILVIDLWEHAYMTQFGINRKEYIEIILNYINYPVLEKRYDFSIEKVKVELE